MNRKTATFEIADPPRIKALAFKWSRSFSPIAFLDSNQYQSDRYGSFELLIAVGSNRSIKLNTGSAFSSLQKFVEENQDWAFGFLGYELKNEVEQLSSGNFDGINLPNLYFFQPEIVITLQKNKLTIASLLAAPDDIYSAINTITDIPPSKKKVEKVAIGQRVIKSAYLDTIRKVRAHIKEGDVYELNFCQEFYSNDVEINPYDTFIKLNERAQAPFSTFLKLDGKFLLCTSPERFLKKVDNKLISQPIKGTIRRGENDEEDRLLRDQLFNDLKERAENVMIVDLVRNDLGRSAKFGTIEVEELFGVYPFVGVNQMISTVTAELREGLHPVEVLKNAFPMGSMTGAPKVRAMQLIEQYEKTKRGLYSGAIGYFTPEKDFDFNVVIRSILYNSEKKYLSYQVGGAITYDSVAEKEYEECLLKAKNLLLAIHG